MYRLSQIRDERLEKIISKELQNGFDNIFHFSSNDEEVIRIAALHSITEITVFTNIKPIDITNNNRIV